MSYTSASPNAPIWPLSQAYFNSASLTGPCLIELRGPTPPSDDSSSPCHPIFAQCQAGSTNFTTAVSGAQSFTCGYQVQNVTVDSAGDILTVACGLISINATVSYPDGLISLSNPYNLASQNVAFSFNQLDLGSTLNKDNGSSVAINVPIWPSMVIDLADSVDGIYPFIVASSSTYASINSSTPSATTSSSTSPASASKIASPSAAVSAKSTGVRNRITSAFNVVSGLAVFWALSTVA